MIEFLVHFPWMHDIDKSALKYPVCLYRNMHHNIVSLRSIGTSVTAGCRNTVCMAQVQPEGECRSEHQRL